MRKTSSRFDASLHSSLNMDPSLEAQNLHRFGEGSRFRLFIVSVGLEMNINILVEVELTIFSPVECCSHHGVGLSLEQIKIR